MTIFLTPSPWSRSIASFDVAFGVSDTVILPMHLPSSATNRTVPPVSPSSSSGIDAPLSATIFPFPTMTERPSTSALTPCPLSSTMSVAIGFGRFTSSALPYTSTIDFAIGWVDIDSAAAANRRTSTSAYPPHASIPETENEPLVSVPVLSIAIASREASPSR